MSHAASRGADTGPLRGCCNPFLVPEPFDRRLVIDGDTVAEVPRTTSREIDRYKAYATRPRRR